MKVYIVIEIGDPPRIVGVFKKRADAERIAGVGESLEKRHREKSRGLMMPSVL